MINILFITYGLEKNGTEEFIMNVLRGLDKEHFHADFLLFSEDSQAQCANRAEAESFGAKIYRLPSRRSGLRYYKSLNQFFKEKRGVYNAVHWNEGNMSTIMPIYYAWKYDVPVRIIHAHNSDAAGYFTKVQHIFNKIFNLKYSNYRFACSSLAAEFFFNGKDTKVIKNGIVLENFLFSEEVRAICRKTLNINDDTFVIGHVGRFTMVKNQSFILDIFNEICAIEENSILLLIGVGECMEDIKRKTVDLHLQNKVIFLGLQNNVNEWMQVFDIFLMPSLYEGLPFVLVEAQSAGLPCLISDNINKDAAITRNCQFLSLTKGSKEWAKKALNLYYSTKRENMSDVIKNAGFSIENTVRYLQKVYSGEFLK